MTLPVVVALTFVSVYLLVVGVGLPWILNADAKAEREQ